MYMLLSSDRVGSQMAFGIRCWTAELCASESDAWKQREARHNGCRRTRSASFCHQRYPYGVMKGCVFVGRGLGGLVLNSGFHRHSNHFPNHPRSGYLLLLIFSSRSLSLSFLTSVGGMWGMQQWMGEWGKQHANDWRTQVFLFFFLFAHRKIAEGVYY